MDKKLTKNQKEVWTILSTPDDMDFRKFRETYDDFWMTKERNYLYIQDMTSSHIVSCINMLERQGQDYTLAYQGLCREINERVQNRITDWKVDITNEN